LRHDGSFMWLFCGTKVRQKSLTVQV
jgi:hypothetical protein